MKGDEIILRNFNLPPNGNNYVMDCIFSLAEEFETRFRNLWTMFCQTEQFCYIDEILDMDRSILGLNENFFVTTISSSTNGCKGVVEVKSLIDTEGFKKDFGCICRNTLKELAKRYKNSALMLYLEVN